MGALLLLSPLSSSLSPISFSSPSSSRLQAVSLGLHPKFTYGFRIQAPLMPHQRGSATVMASSGDNETGQEGEEDESEGEEESIPIQNLPLESKLQLKLEQKMKMKIAKKIRLRRKRLMRKRRMRKRGRWPPSKMKKLKNV